MLMLYLQFLDHHSHRLYWNERQGTRLVEDSRYYEQWFKSGSKNAAIYSSIAPWFLPQGCLEWRSIFIKSKSLEGVFDTVA